MKNILIFCSFIFLVKTSAQVNTDSIYLEYDESMVINQYYDTLKNLHIDIRFTLSNSDIKAIPTTYNYWIDNNSLEGDLRFENINNKMFEEDIKRINMLTLDDLKRLSSCDLFFLLADKKIYLIKESNKKYYKYSLGYKSTQRGIEYSNNSHD